MPIHYIGRESYFHGKSIFEIARNLRKFGEGRYVYRVSFSKRFKEPSFYKLLKVVPEMNAKVCSNTRKLIKNSCGTILREHHEKQGYCRGTAVGEKVFRGVNYGICKIESGGKLDWRLIPKEEEHKWIDAVKEFEQKPMQKPVIESTCKVPYLMELLLSDEKLAYEIPFTKEEATIVKRNIRSGKFNRAGLATE